MGVAVQTVSGTSTAATDQRSTARCIATTPNSKLEYTALKHAILQHIGHTFEQHHQHFHALILEEVGQL